MPGAAKAFDCAAEDSGALAQLGGGDKLARAVRDAYVAGAEDYGVGAEFGQLRRLCAEGEGARRVARLAFERLDERRVGARLDARVQTRDDQLAVERFVFRAQRFDFAANQLRDKLRLLPRHRAPFEREVAAPGTDVLG